MAEQCAAASDVASQDRFDYFWSQRGEWVEEPNVRRGGESGVQRLMGSDGQLLYVKRQTGHIHRGLLHPSDGRRCCASVMHSPAFAYSMCEFRKSFSAKRNAIPCINGAHCW